MVEEIEQAYLFGILLAEFYINPYPAGNFGCGAVKAGSHDPIFTQIQRSY